MGLFDMGEGESNFEGGMSEMRGSSISDYRKKITELQNQNTPQRGGSIATRFRRQSSDQGEQARKMEIERIKKRIKRQVIQRIIRICMMGCVPLLIIFGGAAVISIIWHYFVNSDVGSWLARFSSFFLGDGLSPIVDKLQGTMPVPPAVQPPSP